MRILVFNWQDIKNPLAGGAEVHLHEVFERIVKMGHEVTLFCSKYKGSKSEEILNGIKILRCGNRFLFNFLVPIKYFTSFKKQKFDLIVDDMNKIPFYTPCFVNEPLLGITHHLFGKSIFKEVIFPFAIYVYLAEKLAIKLYKKIKFVVGSPSTYNELLKIGFKNENVSLVHYGINHNLFKNIGIDKSPTPLIGLLGRLKKYKSIDHLIYAFKILKKDFIDAKLVIIGDGDDRQRLESISKNLNLQGDIIFTGFVSEKEKVKWLNKITLAVNTSSKEGWGLTATEANACGTITVSSNVEGLRDAVIDNETGLLYEYGNIAELANKISKLLKNKELTNTMENKAIIRSKEFDWDIAAKKTMEIINTIKNKCGN